MDGTPDGPHDEFDLALLAWQKDPSTANENAVWRHLSPVLKSIAERWELRAGRASRESARDLAQIIATAFLENDRKILRAWDPERGVPAKAFFWLVGTRKLQDRCRKQKELLTPSGALPELTAEGDPETLLLCAARDAAVRDFVELVATPDQLEIYRCVYERGLSLEESAVELNKSPDAIAAAHHRLKKALRRALRLLEDDDPLPPKGPPPRPPSGGPPTSPARPRTLRERLRKSILRSRPHR